MSLFRKPKKNIRQRMNVSDEEESESSGLPIQALPAKLEDVPIKTESSNKLSTKTPKQSSGELKKKSSVLSFQEDLEEDDGIETFQVKKSSQSRRIAKRMERDRKLKEQEKKATSKIKESSENIQPLEEPSAREPCPKSPKPLILSGREAEMAGYRSESDEESEEEGITIKFKQPDQFRNILESGAIPDAATIHAARKQRQQARELGGLADYIKIDDANYPSKDSQPASAVTARLVREDEHDKSDEEENEDGRVDFTVDMQKKDKQERQEAFLAAENSDEHDADSEEDDWERQQFQKALRQRQVENAYQELSLQNKFIEGKSSGKRSPKREVASGLPVRPARDPNTAPDLTKLAPLPNPRDILETLRERLSGFEVSYKRHANDLEIIESKLSDCKLEVQLLQQSRPKLSEKFDFFQVMRGYVHDLVDCLSTKYTEIDALEKRWFSLLAKRNKYLLERRREDVRDEASDCAIQSVIVQTINPDKLARTAEREARRRRRRNSRKDSSKHKDGLSSDDEPSEKEAKTYMIEEGKILDENKRLFEDVVEDFCSLNVIIERFEDWRKQYKESFQDAYVEMFLPRLAGCIIRHQLLLKPWNPLQHELTFLNKSKWFQTLTEHDVRSLNDDSSERKDQNPPVISKTIELVILPYVVEIVKAAYDPCSTSQTNRLVILVKTLSKEHPHLSGSNKVMQSLITAATDKFEASVDQDVFIPFHFVNQNPGFVSRQFWFAAKLFRNILHWQTLADDTQLRSVAVDKLLKRYMMLPLTKMTARGSSSDPDTLDKIRWIAEALPKSWLGPMVPNSSQLQPLIETTMSLAQSADSTTSSGRKYVKEVASVLQKLGAAAEAQEILAKYL